MSIFIILRLEKGIAQRHRLNPLRGDIIGKLRVNVEEYRHIHRLARVQSLLFKAKALDLGEVRRHLSRRHTVRSHPNNVLLRGIGRCIESQRGLAGQDTHFALIGNELPWEDVRSGAIKCYTNARVVFNGTETFGRIAGVVAVGCGFDGLAAPASGLANLLCLREINNVADKQGLVPSYTLVLSRMIALLYRE